MSPPVPHRRRLEAPANAGRRCRCRRGHRIFKFLAPPPRLLILRISCQTSRMRNLTILLALTFTVMFSTPVFAGNAKSNSLTVYDLKNDGWWVVEQKSYVEVRPGEHSYSSLKRYVQVVVYILQKAEKQQKCIMEYDSQNDTLTEECIKL